MEYIVLNNGVKCPVIGIGTYMLSPAEAENSVREALRMGYSLVDTANAYVNERAVGRGMRDSGVKREDIPTRRWRRSPSSTGACAITTAPTSSSYCSRDGDLRSR